MWMVHELHMCLPACHHLSSGSSELNFLSSHRMSFSPMSPLKLQARPDLIMLRVVQVVP